MNVTRHDMPPVANTDAGRILVDEWHKAKRERDASRDRHGTHANLEMTLAGHKMDWLKHLIRRIVA